MSPHSKAKRSYGSPGEVENVVRKFESCTLPPSEFDHRAHLTVALWYLTHSSVPEATHQMRAGLYRFLSHYGHYQQKYNETITVFWMRWVRSFLDRANMSHSIADIANEMIASCSNSQLIFAYYSKERVMSEEARATWIEPDQKPLDF